MSTTGQPPAGFGKGVNDYYNFYVYVTDLKASAFLAANLAAVVLALRVHPAWWFPADVRWLSLAAFGVSTFFCAWTVFPRLHKGHMGVVFWEDVRLFPSITAYRQELGALNEKGVEDEYAAQNWYVSNVLHKKNRAVRWAIGFFFVAVGLAVVSYFTLS
jgi:hypothetical protein